MNIFSIDGYSARPEELTYLNKEGQLELNGAVIFLTKQNEQLRAELAEANRRIEYLELCVSEGEQQLAALRQQHNLLQSDYDIIWKELEERREMVKELRQSQQTGKPVAHMWADDGLNLHVALGPPLDSGCEPLYLAPQPSQPSDGALLIDHDAGMDRYYIPVHTDWEIQTKGKGSSFRIANSKTGKRWIVMDGYLHEMLEQMARDINAAMQKGTEK